MYMLEKHVMCLVIFVIFNFHQSLLIISYWSLPWDLVMFHCPQSLNKKIKAFRRNLIGSLFMTDIHCNGFAVIMNLLWSDVKPPTCKDEQHTDRSGNHLLSLSLFVACVGKKLLPQLQFNNGIFIRMML